MFFSVFGIRSRISVLLLSIFLLLPSTWGQGGIVTIEDLSAYSAQPTDVQLCLWEPGQDDVAGTVGCPTPVANTCYCPTGIVQQAAVLSAITGCMTYWYSVTGGINVAAATSVYNEYCQNATGQFIILRHEHGVSALTFVYMYLPRYHSYPNNFHIDYYPPFHIDYYHIEYYHIDCYHIDCYHIDYYHIDSHINSHIKFGTRCYCRHSRRQRRGRAFRCLFSLLSPIS